FSLPRAHPRSPLCPYTTLFRSIDELFGKGTATALNATKVSVRAPVTNTQRMSFMAMLERLDVEEGRTRPKVVFNSRTGTVVVGEDRKSTRLNSSHVKISYAVFC